MRIAVIGGGVAGLGAAYFLARRGYPVDVYEQAPELGGLAGTFDFDGFRAEKYYHFICRCDHGLLRMLTELGLADEVEWRPGKMRFAYGSELFRFETAWDLLRFRPLSWQNRLRFGLAIAWCRHRTAWHAYERQTASVWLRSRFGTEAYEAVWAPLLTLKFGRFASQVSAAWIWHRIYRLARSRDGLLGRERLGFLRGGTDVLLKRLVATLREHDVALHTNAPVARVRTRGAQVYALEVRGTLHPYDVVISTVPLPVLARMLENAPPGFVRLAQSVEYLAVACVVLRMQRPLSDGFWINVHAPGVPFTGLIEYTNLNPRTDAALPHLVYVPYYLPPDDERWRWTDADLVAATIAGLKQLFGPLAGSAVTGVRVFRDRYAQAVCRPYFSRLVPPLRGPLAGLYLTDSTQLYPADRTISGMFELAERLADTVAADCPLSAAAVSQRAVGAQ